MHCDPNIECCQFLSSIIRPSSATMGIYLAVRGVSYIRSVVLTNRGVGWRILVPFSVSQMDEKLLNTKNSLQLGLSLLPKTSILMV